VPSTLPAVEDPRLQRWPWWPLLPLYPYGRRPTLMRELVPGRVWCFEQLHGVWYVAVPIRMTVLKVEGGLLLYSPIPATEEVISGIRSLEREHGPVLSIVLATSSGLEHKIPVPALCRAFPTATLWVSDRQWSFPLNLPPGWLGFPPERTKTLGLDGLPHDEQLAWLPLGPVNLGLGVFHELACVDHESHSLLVTDALVSFTAQPPCLFDLDPTPLLFHSRDYGHEPLIDSQAQRAKGWLRILLFANFFRPSSVVIPGIPELISDFRAGRNRMATNHFGFFPFRWTHEWQTESNHLLKRCTHPAPFTLAPVLEKLVFSRCKHEFINWLYSLSELNDVQILIGAHYDAPKAVKHQQFKALAESIEQQRWAPSDGSWSLLGSLDQFLLRAGIIPENG